MRRSELLKVLAREHPAFSRQEIKGVVDVFFNEMAETLAGGSRVELRGFGTLSTRSHRSGWRRNPNTGEAVEVADRRALHFRLGKGMLQRLNPSDD